MTKFLSARVRDVLSDDIDKHIRQENKKRYPRYTDRTGFIKYWAYQGINEQPETPKYKRGTREQYEALIQEMRKV